jgi:acyl-coenzyme A synthetase/AMP-(fatty) acid ligase
LTPRAFTIAFNMFRRYSAIDQFRVIQKKRDRFHVVVKLKAARRGQAQQLRTDLVTHLRETIGLPASSVTFDVEVVDAIPLDPTGKLMTVKSEL